MSRAALKLELVNKRKNLTCLAFLVFYLLFQGLNAEKQNAIRRPYHLTDATCREESVLGIAFLFKASLSFSGMESKERSLDSVHK